MPSLAAMPTIVKTKKRKVVEEEEAAPAGPENKPAKVKKTKVKASVGEEAEAAESSKPAAAAAPGVLTDDEYRKEHDVRVKGLAAGGQLYQNFTDAPFPERLQKCLLSQGFKAPSPIQVRLQS